MVSIEMSKVQVGDFRAFLGVAKGEDLKQTSLEDFHWYSKALDTSIEVNAPIQTEREARVVEMNASLKPLQEAAAAASEETVLEAKRALNEEANRLAREEEKRLVAETVTFEVSDELHKFLKENFMKLFVHKTNSGPASAGLAKALKVF